MNAVGQVALGIIVGVGFLVWVLISAALSDRRRNEEREKQAKESQDGRP